MGRVRLLAVEDDRGESLLPEPEEEKIDAGDALQFYAEVAIKPPRPEATKLRKVRGILPVYFPERPKTVELPAAAGGELRLPNLTLRIEEMKAGGSAVRIAGRIEDIDKAYVLFEPRDLVLKDKDGRRIPAQGVRSGSLGSPVWHLSFEPPDGFEPASLVLTVYEGSGRHDIPFSFEDVPLR